MDIFESLNSVVNQALSSIYETIPKPDYLFHYTSQKALLSMITKGELWLTGIRTMNDPREGTFGIDVIQRLLAGNTVTQDIVDIISNYKNRGLVEDHLEYMRPTYITSFTTEEDSLPDWVSYGSDGRGVSIKFKRLELLPLINKALEDKPFQVLFPVFYFSSGPMLFNEANRPLINNLLEAAAQMADLIKQAPPESLNVLKALIFDSLMIFATMIKTDFHKRENEWRLIIRLRGPGELQNVDVIDGQNLRTIYKVLFPEHELYSSGPKISQMGSVVESIYIGPRTRNTGLEHAIRTLTYKRWGGWSHVLPSAGILS